MTVQIISTLNPIKQEYTIKAQEMSTYHMVENLQMVHTKEELSKLQEQLKSKYTDHQMIEMWL